MIVGQPGAGKSTLAAKLRNGTGLPIIHIDKLCCPSLSLTSGQQDARLDTRY
jgi:adenylate kinase family enzyme